MEPKHIAFRNTVKGGISDFLEDSSLNGNANLESGIFSIVDRIRGYKEESVAMRPRVFVVRRSDLSTFKSIAATGNSVTLASGQYEPSIFKKAIKLAAPLAINGWDIFISVDETQYEFGIFTAGPRFHAVDPTLQPLGIPIIIIHSPNDSIVELINGKGNKLQLLFSAKKDGDFSLFKDIKLLSSGILKTIDDAEAKNKACSLIEDVLTRSYSIEKGCLIGIMKATDNIESLGFSDKLALTHPLDIYQIAENYTQSKSIESYSKFAGLAEVIAGMLGTDGITIFDNAGKIVAYNCFVEFDSASARPIGGARTRAFESLKRLLHEDKLEACFMLSQDGDSNWSSK